jgi:stage II sporulation protein D
MRTRRTAAVAVAGAVLATAGHVGALGGATPAQAAATDQSYWVPVGKQLTVRGHGYGHGHGMSQHGAHGAALKGLSYKEIVDFYYPGTAWSKVTGRVRVLITADTSDDVVVSPTAGLSVRDRGNGSAVTLPRNGDVSRWRLSVREGKSVVEKYTDRWRRFRPDGKEFLAGEGEFFADGPLTLWTPSGARVYRGTLRAAAPSSGSTARDTVNVVTMDQYVMGVVPYEMPASWHMEAVKSQAVAARTYATWSRNQNRSRYYQICDTTACQVYGGVSNEHPRSNQAVSATRRQILSYGGKPAFTQFSASSGGWTSAGSVPYLPAKRDPYDDWEGNTVHDWAVTIDAGRLERSYPSIGNLRRVHVTRRDGNGEWQGRVQTLVLDGTTGTRTLSGDDFRWAFGLRSTWFAIDPTPIIARWVRIGGADSPVGDVQSAEYAVRGGAAQRFEHGRIFWSEATGARELYGPTLRRYTKAGGPDSVLGLPRSLIRARHGGLRTRFQNGTIYWREASGAILVYGAIDRRYVREGGLASPLGWPLGMNYAVPGGERVDYQHGYIRWDRASGSTRMVVTP